MQPFINNLRISCMKKIFLILIIFCACKKKTVTPVDPPTCETHSQIFDGRFQCDVVNANPTFTITFLNNNCPTENSNTYVAKGLAQTLKQYLKTGQTLAVKDYTLSSNESNKTAINSEEGITISIDRNGLNVLYISTNKITSKITYIRR